MKYRTAIISTEFMDTRVKEAVLPFEEHCTFTTYYYKKSSEIPEIYKSIEDKYDGFIVNGIISRAMLRAACPDTKKPIETFHVDMLAYYQELFRLMTLKPDLKAERLYADFMMGKNIREAVENGTLDAEGENFCSLVAHMSLEELKQVILARQAAEKGRQAGSTRSSQGSVQRQRILRRWGFPATLYIRAFLTCGM